jgi:hypothetical protein
VNASRAGSGHYQITVDGNPDIAGAIATFGLRKNANRICAECPNIAFNLEIYRTAISDASGGSGMPVLNPNLRRRRAIERSLPALPRPE